MRRMRTFGTLSGAVALAVMGAACSDRAQDQASDSAREAGAATREAARDAGEATRETARDAGEAARDAGRGVAGAVREGGEAADAAVQTMDVKMALTTDSRVDASDINVDTNHETKTVTLKGHVKTAAQKTLAGDIATRRADGYRVVNDLTVSDR